jgi:hypothetical protein
MNETTMQSTTAAVGSGRSSVSDDPGGGRTTADYERGVELFILAAATFFRSAAQKPERGRRRPKVAGAAPSRKAAAVETKRRTIAKRSPARTSAKAE